MNHQTVTSRYRLARAAHIHRAKERSARVAWFFTGIIIGLVMAAAWRLM